MNTFNDVIKRYNYLVADNTALSPDVPKLKQKIL